MLVLSQEQVTGTGGENQHLRFFNSILLLIYVTTEEPLPYNPLLDPQGGSKTKILENNLPLGWNFVWMMKKHHKQNFRAIGGFLEVPQAI